MTTPTSQVKLSTSLGDIVIELDHEKAPISSKNFSNYVASGFYDGTIFHRIIADFMAQGGGFDSNFQQKPTQANIQNEADNGLKNKRGTLAMARTSDPHSASGQFFINYKDNGFLDYTSSTPNGWGYAVFAKVISGMEVVDSFAAIATTSKNGHDDVPSTDIVVNSASFV